MKRYRKIFLIFILVSGILVWGISVRITQADVQKMSFDDVEVFAGTSGYIKFFDKKTGKLYVYTQDLEECTSIVQLQELGQPGVVISQ